MQSHSTTEFLDTWQALLDKVLIFGLAIQEDFQSMLVVSTSLSMWDAFIIAQALIKLKFQISMAKIHQEETLHASNLMA